MDINVEYISRPYTDEPFLNMGIGSIMLAYEHKRLYRDIVEQKGISEKRSGSCALRGNAEF